MDPIVLSLLLSLSAKAIAAGFASNDEQAAYDQARKDMNASVDNGVKVADEALKKLGKESP